ncbi:hypothetical protein K227x_46740 [Rubripirellula lacrimiformis]|uniref:Uncharacterized protein n=1 Tax=Rubripirellula lacrimiformis TaxID=1930273 RepID=A0A517NGK2_9BACT|nr:hypothetical protein K227x_46740 [Rubripirellula lacrimiformis]
MAVETVAVETVAVETVAVETGELETGELQLGQLSGTAESRPGTPSRAENLGSEPFGSHEAARSLNCGVRPQSSMTGHPYAAMVSTDQVTWRLPMLALSAIAADAGGTKSACLKRWQPDA